MSNLKRHTHTILWEILEKFFFLPIFSYYYRGFWENTTPTKKISKIFSIFYVQFIKLCHVLGKSSLKRKENWEVVDPFRKLNFWRIGIITCNARLRQSLSFIPILIAFQLQMTQMTCLKIRHWLFKEINIWCIFWKNVPKFFSVKNLLTIVF